MGGEGRRIKKRGKLTEEKIAWNEKAKKRKKKNERKRKKREEETERKRDVE